MKCLKPILSVFLIGVPLFTPIYPISFNSSSDTGKYDIVPIYTADVLISNTTLNESSSKESRCLQTSRWIGAISGSFMGVAHIYFRATGVSGPQGPFWKNLVTVTPSIVVGAYVGSKATDWTTRQIMKGNPKLFRAALKGTAYGAIDGAIILTAQLVPLFLMAHYMDTIDFNMSNDMIVLKLLGMSLLGGTLFGGMTGAVVGVVYGPCVSLYMKF